MPFSVTVRYWQAGRGPDRLWVMPYLVDESGRVVHYIAAGPAGKPASVHLVRELDLRRVPGHAELQVSTEKDQFGRPVFGRLQHTMN
jgi:hypothetical protein